MSIITFLSDFGLQDGYVGAVKGKILSLNPDAQIIDISHEIRPYQIHEAAYVLMNYYNTFPKGSVHLAVVDPGVGSKRRGLIIQTAKYFLVGPDNGLFSYILQNEAFKAFEIVAGALNTEVSATFHGRDVFAPVAANVAAGIAIEKMSKKCETAPLSFESGRMSENNSIIARIISIDHFGNIITDFSRSRFLKFGALKIHSIQIKNETIQTLSRTYSDVADGKLLGLWSSSGFLEISVNKGNAAKRVDAAIGKQEVIIQLGD